MCKSERSKWYSTLHKLKSWIIPSYQLIHPKVVEEMDLYSLGHLHVLYVLVSFYVMPFLSFKTSLSTTLNSQGIKLNLICWKLENTQQLENIFQIKIASSYNSLNKLSERLHFSCLIFTKHILFLALFKNCYNELS